MKTEFDSKVINTPNIPKQNVNSQEDFNKKVNNKKTNEVTNNIDEKPVNEQQTNDKQSKGDEYYTKDELDKAMKKADEILFRTGRAVEYSVHKASKQIVIKVINAETKEVLSELPKEASLDNLVRTLEQTGIIMDTKR